jgi:mono/diheme cytochrome c family protein
MRHAGSVIVKGVVMLSIASVLMLACVFELISTRASTQPTDLRRDEVANALFLKNCATCHGKDGRAKTFKAKFNHARDLTNPNWQAAISDEHMYESILRGKNKMPAFGKKLSENEVAALVTYVRMLKR